MTSPTHEGIRTRSMLRQQQDNGDHDLTNQQPSSSTNQQSESVMDDPNARAAIHHLVYYSIAMFTLPVIAMFTSKVLIFQGWYYVIQNWLCMMYDRMVTLNRQDCFHMDPSEATLYGGFVAICVVCIIVILFVRDALNDAMMDNQSDSGLKNTRDITNGHAKVN